MLIPFLLWSLIAVAYYLAISWRLDGAPDWTAAVDKLKHLPAKPTAIHLWFMYALIPLYILSPFIKKMIDALDRNLVVYLLSLWLFFSAVLPTVAAFLPQSFSSILVLDRRYDLSIMAGYAGYFVAGYYLMRWHKPVRKAWLGVVVLVDVVCIALGTWWKTTALGEYGEVFKTYSGVFVVVLYCRALPAVQGAVSGAPAQSGGAGGRRLSRSSGLRRLPGAQPTRRPAVAAGAVVAGRRRCRWSSSRTSRSSPLRSPSST